jgi:hypothetical protein
VSGRKAAPVVTRYYKPALDECVHALQALLDQPVTKMVVRPTTHEPDDRDRTKSKEDSANVILPQDP